MAETGDVETGFMTPGEQSPGHRRVRIEAGKIRGRQPAVPDPSWDALESLAAGYARR